MSKLTFLGTGWVPAENRSAGKGTNLNVTEFVLLCALYFDPAFLPDFFPTSDSISPLISW
jgi:hypothetical protein